MHRHSSRSCSRAATSQRSIQVVAEGCVRMLSGTLRLLHSVLPQYAGTRVAERCAPWPLGRPVLF